MKSQDGQAQLRQTGFRWIKALTILDVCPLTFLSEPNEHLPELAAHGTKRRFATVQKVRKLSREQRTFRCLGR
jgi:hypothetical protein